MACHCDACIVSTQMCPLPALNRKFSVTPVSVRTDRLPVPALRIWIRVAKSKGALERAKTAPEHREKWSVGFLANGMMVSKSLHLRSHLKQLKARHMGCTFPCNAAVWEAQRGNSLATAKSAQ